jgi:hypothetical protein
MTESSEGEILKASGPGPAQIEIGMRVSSMDAQPIGKVKEVTQDEFLVDRPLAHDLWIPYSAVMATEDFSANVRGPVRDTQVVLNVTAAHVDRQGWRHP